MENRDQHPSQMKRVIEAPSRAWHELLTVITLGLVRLRNRIRKWRRLQIDYVVLPIEGPLPERAAPPRGFIERRLPFPQPSQSLQQLNSRFQKIADADNVRGVLIVFRGIQTGLATLQNLRLSILRLRENGKQVVVFTPYLDLRHYYVATAADRIIVPPGSQFEVLGLHAEAVFLKDALQQVGVQIDVVQISPYKTGLDTLQHANMTPEFREQLEWLLDDQFDMITADMADGRSMSQIQMQDLIDEAPFFAQMAREKGLIDDLAYEDELVYLLAETTPIGREKSVKNNERDSKPADEEHKGQSPKHKESDDKARARIRSWAQASKALSEKYYRRTRPFIGVVSMEGLIVMGPSRQVPFNVPIPFVGGATVGEQSLVRLLRKAEKQTNMAALILHVDSSGGSALASELIGRQIQRVGEKIPVVVYMGNVAASGGYYVSSHAAHIMSQQATLTGSIGVIAARAAAQAFYEKVKINRVTIQKGKRANLYRDLTPLASEEQQIFEEIVNYAYEDFKRTVAQGRKLPYETLDAICEGRVWTGRQAKIHKLVDSHGDFVAAITKAAELAGLEYEHIGQIRVANLYSKGDNHVLPLPYETAQEIGRLLSNAWIKELNGRPLMLMPTSLEFD